MSALVLALLAATNLIQVVNAQGDDYTVWASVIFARGGERTPVVLGDLPTTLTSLGANQQFNNGEFFRKRYIGNAVDGTSNGSSAPLKGLAGVKPDPLQLYVAALDEQWTIASAQAFMQGLYPPYTLNNSVARMLDPTGLLANGTYMDNPLDNYQYVQIHGSGAFDPEFPYMGGSLNCPAFNAQADEITQTAEFKATQAESKQIYQAVGPPLLDGVIQDEAWDYYNAYAIYDYLNYRNAHNTTSNALLAEPEYISPVSDVNYLDQLRWYADQQQFAQLGNLTRENNYVSKDHSVWPTDVSGGISTIAGNLLAAKLLGQLQLAIQYGGEYYKLNVLFGDFDPLMSFFSLNGLPERNSNFYGLPDFGSVAVIELYTENSAITSFPSSTDDLWVRFWFRNGTGDKNDNDNGDFRSYPLFSRGPSSTEMRWSEFERGMYEILLPSIGNWCASCGATNIFCSAWNTSLAYDTYQTATEPKASSPALTPATAGAIGAVVGLVVAGLIFAAVLLLGGVRFHRVGKNHKSELGGFKGSQKLASDKDLTVPKGGATIGASIERAEDSPVSPIGHERVGSWEMKQAEGDQHREADGMRASPRSSMDNEGRLDPFRDPVRADERV